MWVLQHKLQSIFCKPKCADFLWTVSWTVEHQGVGVNSIPLNQHYSKSSCFQKLYCSVYPQSWESILFADFNQWNQLYCGQTSARGPVKIYHLLSVRRWGIKPQPFISSDQYLIHYPTDAQITALLEVQTAQGQTLTWAELSVYCLWEGWRSEEYQCRWQKLKMSTTTKCLTFNMICISENNSKGNIYESRSMYYNKD